MLRRHRRSPVHRRARIRDEREAQHAGDTARTSPAPPGCRQAARPLGRASQPRPDAGDVAPVRVSSASSAGRSMRPRAGRRTTPRPDPRPTRRRSPTRRVEASRSRSSTSAIEAEPVGVDVDQRQPAVAMHPGDHEGRRHHGAADPETATDPLRQRRLARRRAGRSSITRSPGSQLGGELLRRARASPAASPSSARMPSASATNAGRPRAPTGAPRAGRTGSPPTGGTRRPAGGRASRGPCRAAASIVAFAPSAQVSAVRPSVSTNGGSSSSTCRSSQPVQRRASARVGVRFAGGRHFSTLSTAASVRASPASAISSSSSWPPLPTNGRPATSSFAPGASPTTSSRGRRGSVTDDDRRTGRRQLRAGDAAAQQVRERVEVAARCTPAHAIRATAGSVTRGVIQRRRRLIAAVARSTSRRSARVDGGVPVDHRHVPAPRDDCSSACGSACAITPAVRQRREQVAIAARDQHRNVAQHVERRSSLSWTRKVSKNSDITSTGVPMQHLLHERRPATAARPARRTGSGSP